MSISPAGPTHNGSNSDLKIAHFKRLEEPADDILPDPNETRAGQKAETDAKTLEAHLNVSVGVQEKPMQLLYKAAIEAIDEELEEILGPDSTQRNFDAGIDFSPEATADRIIKASTAFFYSYQEQHPEENLEEQLDNFIAIISGGVDQGFDEARHILDGLGVLEGDIEDNINRTYDFVIEGYQGFRDRILEQQTTTHSTNDNNDTRANRVSGSNIDTEKQVLD